VSLQPLISPDKTVPPGLFDAETGVLDDGFDDEPEADDLDGLDDDALCFGNSLAIAADWIANALITALTVNAEQNKAEAYALRFNPTVYGPHFSGICLYTHSYTEYLARALAD
jgi:hypothetical protein